MSTHHAAGPTDSSRAVAPASLSPALIIVGLLLVAANMRIGITAVGPLLGVIEKDLGLPAAAASVLVSLPLLAFAVVSPFAPAIARRLGMERTLGLSLGVLAVGLVIRSVPGSVLLWGGTALVGVSIAVINVVLPALVKRDFPTRIGQVTGAYSAVLSTFAALSAGFAVPLAGATALSWRLPLGIGAAFAVVGILVLLPQLRRHTVIEEREADVSAAPLRSPWRSSLAWQVTAFMGLQSIGYYFYITWLPSVEVAAGRSAAIAGLDQLLLNGFGIAGSLLCSALIPRMGDQRLLATVSPFLFVVATTGVLLAPQLATVWACIAGLSGGASLVLALSFFGLRTVHHTQAASLSGMAQSIGYLAAAAAPVVAGALHDATGSWHPALIGLIVAQVLLVLFGYLAGRARTV